MAQAILNLSNGKQLVDPKFVFNEVTGELKIEESEVTYYFNFYEKKDLTLKDILNADACKNI